MSNSTEMNVIVQTPDQAVMDRSATNALNMVSSFEIVDAPTFELAADELKAIKSRAKDLEERRKAITKPLDDAKKSVMDLFRRPVEVLGKAESLLKAKMLDYQREEDRKANEARRAAEKAAAEERRKIEAEAEKLRAEGKDAEADETEQLADIVVASRAPAAEPTKVAGISTRKSVNFEVEDLLALVQHIAKNPELISLVKADNTKIRGYVRGLGLQCNLPGVAVFEEQSLAARR